MVKNYVKGFKELPFLKIIAKSCFQAVSVGWDLQHFMTQALVPFLDFLVSVFIKYNNYLLSLYISICAEDEVVRNFLWVDSCAKMSDRVTSRVSVLIIFFFLQYLLAMVYVYFRRASLPLDQYSRFNFFVAL